ncbi:hypothetical protein POPTR_019G126800v4 [Populus trichocarpa]|uniref:Uncharacterized protein n=1 Tax=Populus trichocarpa TaxID=3694 RepID=A0ACC0RL33_POPTR|nr:uncharacterized protein LOC7458829 [Populus trichocarpa]KAI9377813.1 hypothetical protein POPTR_019G126800v4 [Populus trichocarpa]
MFSREQEREAMFKKLQLLRSITNSHAHDKASVILDASKYIKDLKQRVERLNQDIATAASFTGENFPTIRVEEQEDDFLIKVFTTRNCQGLLVFILEAFEELSLEVLQARVSTSDSFILEAIATRENKEAGDHIDAQVVEQVVLQGIQKWIEVSEQE